MQIYSLPKFASDNFFLTKNSRRAAPQRQAGSTLGESALKNVMKCIKNVMKCTNTLKKTQGEGKATSILQYWKRTCQLRNQHAGSIYCNKKKAYVIYLLSPILISKQHFYSKSSSFVFRVLFLLRHRLRNATDTRSCRNVRQTTSVDVTFIMNSTVYVLNVFASSASNS